MAGADGGKARAERIRAGLVKRIDRSLDARPLGTPDTFDAALAEWKR